MINRVSEEEQIYNYECLDCGYQRETEEHRYNLRCPLCGGAMWRLERPGPGRISQGESGQAVGLAFFAGLFTAVLGNIITEAIARRERSG